MPGKTAKSVSVERCPCGSALAYASCCGLFHEGATAPTAAELMRSRYSAYVLDRHAYLLATWAAGTRPAALDLAPPRPKWLGLKVLAACEEGDRAEVEFIASYKINGRAQRMHEISRFVREDGKWYYLDGIFPDEPE